MLSQYTREVQKRAYMMGGRGCVDWASHRFVSALMAADRQTHFTWSNRALATYSGAPNVERSQRWSWFWSSGTVFSNTSKR